MVLVRYNLSVTIDEIVWLTLTQEYEPQENKELVVFIYNSSSAHQGLLED